MNGKEVTWREENESADVADGKTETQVTCEVIQQMLNTLMPGLTFTTESEEDFCGWLPTLDSQVHMESRGEGEKRLIRYKFFEKPMSNVKVAESGSAHPINNVYATLAQEVCSRLLRCDNTTCND